MEIVEHLLLAIHVIGVALIVGPFFFQLRVRSGINFTLMLIGAIIQVVTGLALAGITAGDDDVPVYWVAVKATVAIVILAAVIIGILRQRRALAAGTSQRVAQPWLHVAGGLAIVNVLFAFLGR